LGSTLRHYREHVNRPSPPLRIGLVPSSLVLGCWPSSTFLSVSPKWSVFFYVLYFLFFVRMFMVPSLFLSVARFFFQRFLKSISSFCCLSSLLAHCVSTHRAPPRGPQSNRSFPTDASVRIPWYFIITSQDPTRDLPQSRVFLFRPVVDQDVHPSPCLWRQELRSPGGRPEKKSSPQP